jgi:OPA family glycerol-3-phosphate transporter-like MFS transporter
MPEFAMTVYDLQPMEQPLTIEQRHWRYRIFVITWFAYAGFYLCRKNFSVVMPLLQHELGDTNMQLAGVIFGYSCSYTIGQFCSGILSDFFGPRKVVGIGMFVVAVSNILMGFQTSLSAFFILGCLNGAGQSTGWSGLVKNMACWFRQKERGVVMAWWGTNYALGGFVATILATFVVTQHHFHQWGWRRGFWAPAVLLCIVAMGYVLLVRNYPSDARLPAIEEDSSADTTEVVEAPTQVKTGRARLSTSILLKLLEDKTIWVISATYFFLKLTRYAFLFWLPIYMTEHLHFSVSEAGYTSSLYELVGFSGAIIAGYASDKLVQSRRFPVGALMMWGLALAVLIHPSLAKHGHLGNAVGISLIGIMTYGPDSLMSGAAAQDVGSQRGAATAAGLIDGVGSIGQIFSPYVVAFVTEKYGWDALFYLFIAFALIGGCLLTTKWNYKPSDAATT